ncbi:hypothetical protein Trihar35433_6071 [Trichoderma harzianum]|nr:hypothetical protein Trihar35433_6071 [Trichoderma harzianum]
MASIPNYTEMMVLIWVLWGVAFGMTAFRVIFQWRLQRRLHGDDYFVLAGLVSLTALTAVITRILPQWFLIAEYSKALVANPKTPSPLPADEMTARNIMSLKLMFSQMLLFWTTLWAAKFSILWFIRRLLYGLPNYMRWWWRCFAAVLTLYLASGCSLPDDLRRADVSIKFATSADIVADVLTMILPLHLLRNLTISRPYKFGLAILFSLGAIIVAIALVRLVQVTKATGDSAEDPTTIANGPVLLSVWSHIESTVSMIVATLPAFRFLKKRNANTTRTTNKYSVATIGGTGGSRLRPRQHGATNEVTIRGSDSQTELRPVRSET